MPLMEVYRGHLTRSYAQHRSDDALFVRFEMKQKMTRNDKGFIADALLIQISVCNASSKKKKWPRIPSWLKIFVAG